MRKYWVVVPAAGIGSRMQAEIPKQYLSLSGKTVLDMTLSRLLACELIEGIVLALAEEDKWWPESLYYNDARVTAITGGKNNRAESVLAGLQRLFDDGKSGTWVLVHDAARPCLLTSDIVRLIDAVEHQSSAKQGAILARPVNDTMKRSNADRQIKSTVDRELLWHALTPQLFPLLHLKMAIEKALASNLNITDEASSIEALGESPLLVEGRADNIKITHQHDLPLAEFYLQIQQQENV